MNSNNIVIDLHISAHRYPTNVAVHDIDTGRRWTYRELYRRVQETAEAFIACGLKPGEKIALLLTNSPSYIQYFLGAISAGLVVVPLNTRLVAEDYAYMLKDSRTRVLVSEPLFAETLERLSSVVEHVIRIETGSDVATLPPLDNSIEVQNGDVCTLMYTSGTTGPPKAVMLSHGAWNAITDTALELLEFDDKAQVLHAAPLTHGAGFMLMPTIRAGGTNLTSRSFQPEIVQEMLSDGSVTGMFLVPSMIRMLLDIRDGDWKPHEEFRWLYYAGSPITLETFYEACRVFDNRLVQSFAQMEAPMFLTVLTANDHKLASLNQRTDMAKAAGRVIRGRHVEIFDSTDSPLPSGEIGEIVARAPQVMNGYWNRPEDTAKSLHGGWLRTGDLGYFDDDGFLFVVDRKKDMIVSGGSNVYAREVEDTLSEISGVEEVAVVGTPHRVWGEQVTAAVVLQPGYSLRESDVKEYCQGVLAAYKIPKKVVVLSQLPKNAYGKVLKRDLQALCQARLNDEGYATV